MYSPEMRTPPRRLRLKPSIEFLAASTGEIYLLRGHEDFVIEAPPTHAIALLEQLDGSCGSDALAARLGDLGHDVTASEVQGTLRSLDALGLVEDACDDPLHPAIAERYEGQLRYFSDLAAPGARRAEFQERLGDATVVLLGLGGLGSWAALALACCGIGRLRAVDGDVVETGNLNRQVLYRERDVGTAKVHAATATLRAFNSALAYEPVHQRLEGRRDVEEVIAGADFVIDVADWPPGVIERWVNAACFELGIPFLTMSQHPPLIRMGPCYVPGITGCYLCQEAQLRAQSPLFDEVARYRATHQSGAATFGPACGLLGSHAALDAVHQISGVCPPASLGAALMVDLRTLAVTRTDVPRRADCEVCGTAPSPVS